MREEEEDIILQTRRSNTGKASVGKELKERRETGEVRADERGIKTGETWLATAGAPGRPAKQYLGLVIEGFLREKLPLRRPPSGKPSSVSILGGPVGCTEISPTWL